MSSLTQLNSWKKLWQHYEKTKNAHMRDMFAFDKNRQARFSIHLEDMFFDYSKNRITGETIDCLISLAEEVELKEKTEQLFRGENINNTEERPALHTALRLSDFDVLFHQGQDINREIQKQIDQIELLCEQLHCGKLLGFSGKLITDIVNIGIGGSDLGPKFVIDALKNFRCSKHNFHFISNVDPAHFNDKVSELNPETTIFIVASKSFSTQETMFNAKRAKDWFLNQAKELRFMKKHFYAVSTNREEVIHFGISPTNMFTFWDWVGGRYSLWSSIGLSIALAVGMKNFKALHQGARVMDDHFRYSPFSENIPVLMALIGVWYQNFFGFKTHAVLPYSHRLELLPQYLQQTDMESNGKTTSRDGKKIGYSTGPVLWGAQGINGQHAFYQLMHQGSQTIPADFIACVLPENQNIEAQEVLLSNFIAQSEALMKGRTRKETVKSLLAKGISKLKAKERLPHMIFEGNKPSNSILLRQLTPHNLGMLIAMYEHKVFVQGAIWNINSFDQFGVELGKKLAKNVFAELSSLSSNQSHDASTNGLIQNCIYHLKPEQENQIASRHKG